MALHPPLGRQVSTGGFPLSAPTVLMGELCISGKISAIFGLPWQCRLFKMTVTLKRNILLIFISLHTPPLNTFTDFLSQNVFFFLSPSFCPPHICKHEIGLGTFTSPIPREFGAIYKRCACHKSHYQFVGCKNKRDSRLPMKKKERYATLFSSGLAGQHWIPL